MASVELPGEEKGIALPQGTIRYREAGGGDPIVFVHGLLVDGALWRKVVPALASGHLCIVPDLPLGSHRVAMQKDADLSPPGLARIVADFIGALDLGPVTLVANDTGGAISQLVATAYPERLARLVLTNCDAYENFLPPAFRPLQYAARMPGGMSLIVQSMRFDPLRRTPMAYGWLTKRPIPREVLERWTEPARLDREVRRDLRKVLTGISNRYTIEAAEKLREFDRPVLIAWADADRFFKSRFGERLAAAIPGARFERIEDSLTFVPEDQPERLAELIEGFIRESGAGPA